MSEEEYKPKAVLMPDGKFINIKGGTQIAVPFFPNPEWTALTSEERWHNSTKRMWGEDYVTAFGYKEYNIIRDMNGIYIAVEKVLEVVPDSDL